MSQQVVLICVRQDLLTQKFTYSPQKRAERIRSFKVTVIYLSLQTTE